MAIFAASELDRFASDILSARGVTSVFADSSAVDSVAQDNDAGLQAAGHDDFAKPAVA